MDAFSFISCKELISPEEIIHLLWTKISFRLVQTLDFCSVSFSDINIII